VKSYILKHNTVRGRIELVFEDCWEKGKLGCIKGRLEGVIVHNGIICY
jgi:hypothetical protein